MAQRSVAFATRQANLAAALARRRAEVEGSTDLTDHTSDLSNPHEVTQTQVGLGNVDNTSDADKPVSTAQQTALDAKADIAATVLQPAASATPANNGDMVFEATSNTQVTVKLKGTDGTVRSTILTLS